MKAKNNRRPGQQKILLISALALLGVGAAFLALRVQLKYPWFWMLARDQARQILPAQSAAPKHVMFLFVDHFEPHDQKTVDRWASDYPEMASRHQDADGRVPQHTWFWYFDKAGEAERASYLRKLSELAYQGFGEVELHLHHFNDNEESFLKLMNSAIQSSQRFGSMITAEPSPRTALGFIHGLWSLDNSRGAGACGVNNELILLRRLGCYADFTNPSWGVMHPKIVNRHYYATDDPARPKSYDQGTEMESGKPGAGDLLIFQGPSVLHWKFLRPSYDHGEVSMENLPTPERIDRWIKAGIHVKGRPDWIFVKVFAHGAVERDTEAVLGQWRDRIHTHLESQYNDGRKYVLHYVTAREAYNIAKAAESGKSGNPREYRNYVIAPYVNRFFTADLPFEVISFDEQKAVIRFLDESKQTVQARLRGHGVTVTGDAAIRSEALFDKETLIQMDLKPGRVVGFSFSPTQKENFTVKRVAGALSGRPK